MKDRQCSDYANAGRSGGVNIDGRGNGKSPKSETPSSKPKASKSSPMKPMESRKGNY